MTEAIWKTLFSRKIALGSAGLLFLAVAGLWLADPDAFPIVSPFTQAKQPRAAETVAPEPPRSEAERIARLQHSLDEQHKYLDGLTKELHENSEYKKSEKAFQIVDGEREAAQQAIQELTATGKTTEAAKRQAELQNINVRWQKALDLFNLAVKEQKTLRENIAAATRQLQEDQKALARLTGASAPAAASSNANDAAVPPATASAKPSETSTSTPSLPTMPASPYSLVSPTAAAPAPASASSTPSSPANPAADPIAREVERARQEAKRKEEDAKKAESRAESLTERIEVLNENITAAKKLLETARQEADSAQKNKSELEIQLRQKTSAKAAEAELHELTHRIDLGQQRFQKELASIHSTTDHLHELQTELSHLQAAQIRALHDAEAKKQAAEEADEKIVQLQNPFRPRNIVHWLLHHGPRLLLVAVGMFVFYRLARAFSRRVVRLMAQGTSKRGTHQDRENRAQTLAGVFNSALSILVLGGGSLMMLDEVGIPIVPLMGGAAVLGLAVAFGAQNLIKDYFSGFMVLLEDQYGINDVVCIGSVSGMVEHISLRTTVLRDLEGVVHFIPHGTITTVSNQTHGWSRALFDVGVDYKEDIDRVMEVLLELGRELRRDPAYVALILDDPEMLGVDNLADSSVILRFFIKTRPLQQWTVKREMLKRIKRRFDDLRIEIPYPHQTVHHRYDSPPPAGQPESFPFRRAA